MVFIEQKSFMKVRDGVLSEEGLRLLQLALILRPDAGDLIRGAEGLRKIRWKLPGRGKSGGIRVIYYWDARRDHIYLVYAYAKSECGDLTKDQYAILVRAVKGAIGT
jgi:mRNA-degrading endonuclease RelE of RelBE toxin-antitoxin system